MVAGSLGLGGGCGGAELALSPALLGRGMHQKMHLGLSGPWKISLYIFDSTVFVLLHCCKIHEEKLLSKCGTIPVTEKGGPKGTDTGTGDRGQDME